MADYSLTEARAQLPHLLTKAASGEPITITRHGRPEVVLIAHAEWVRSQARSRVMEQARRIRARMEASKGKTREEIGWLVDDYDVDAHVAEIRAGRDREPWDGIETESP